MSLEDEGTRERFQPERVIRRFGDSCLRRQCRTVDFSDAGTADLIKRLWRILEADGGVGLAAPQIGDDSRVVVIRVPDAPVTRSRITMINPEVVETFGAEITFEEGCLSFPGLFFDVLRPEGVVVNYIDEGGHKHQIRDDGILARIVLHEVDHLNGVLFSDHLSFFAKFLLSPRLLLQWIGYFFWKLRNGK